MSRPAQGHTAIDPRRKEFFRIGDSFYSCRPENFHTIKSFYVKFGELPDKEEFPDLKTLANKPGHLSKFLIEDIE